MLNYTFAELLTVYFHLQNDLEQRKTQEDLAKEIAVSRRTVAAWFAGDYTPRTPEVVERLADVLCLTALQADLLLYSVDPTWVKYGTPAAVLAKAEVIRYREEEPSHPGVLLPARPPIAQIERAWPAVFSDTFETNYRRWGVGTKNNGMGHLERALGNKRYTLTLQNQYHEDVFMGGDSNCFAPAVYYLTVKASIEQGDTAEDGYGLMFEEINDECYALLRVREKLGKISVVQTLNGGDQSTVYLRRVSAPSIRQRDVNKLAVLAIHREHWFYVNDALVGQCVIPRLPYSRLDVGVIAGSQQRVVCHFQAFRVLAPPAT